MAEGSYWSNEFSCPTIAAFLHESVCENTEDVAGAGELVFDATDTETRTYTTVAEPWTINSKAMLPHPLLRLRAMLTRSQQRTRVATRPEGGDNTPVRRLETVAKTVWHHSSYQCEASAGDNHAVRYYTASRTSCLHNRD